MTRNHHHHHASRGRRGGDGKDRHQKFRFQGKDHDHICVPVIIIIILFFFLLFIRSLESLLSAPQTPAPSARVHESWTRDESACSLSPVSNARLPHSRLLRIVRWMDGGMRRKRGKHISASFHPPAVDICLLTSFFQVYWNFLPCLSCPLVEPSPASGSPASPDPRS